MGRDYRRCSSLKSDNSSINATKHQSETWPTFVSTLVATLGSLTVGYAMGYPSSALIDLANPEKLQRPEDYAFEKGSTTSDLFVALMPVGALVGSLIGGLMADQTGRKASLVATGIPNFLGWMVIILSYYSKSAREFQVLILTGRVLTGIASGWISTAVPLYVAEIACSKKRGLFGSFYQILAVVGIFLSYAVGAIPNLNYVHSAVVAGMLTLLFEILVLLLYESPRWLISTGRDSSAEKALSWLRQSHEVAKEEAEEIKNIVQNSPKLSIARRLYELRQRHLYVPFILSLTLIFFHQFSGINVIIFYAATIFQTAGIHYAREAAMFAVGALQILATIISSGLVDRAGRKVLLVSGSIGMTISSASLGAHFFITRSSLCGNASSDDANSTVLNSTTDNCAAFAPLAICSLVGFGFAFSVGWRALPFIVISELFPLRLRGLLGGIGLCSLWVYASLITGFYQDYEQAVQQYTAWWTFSLISFLGIFFVLIFIPETKGKTLEEIEAYFKRRKDKVVGDKHSVYFDMQDFDKETTV